MGLFGIHNQFLGRLFIKEYPLLSASLFMIIGLSLIIPCLWAIKIYYDMYKNNKTKKVRNWIIGRCLICSLGIVLGGVLFFYGLNILW
jgi:hypothetical protein